MTETTRNKYKFLFFIPAFISVLATLYMIFEDRMLGFPDGHFTELDNNLHIFYKITIPIFSFFSISFIVIGVFDVLKKGRITLLGCFITSLIIGLLAVYYMVSTLDNGSGG